MGLVLHKPVHCKDLQRSSEKAERQTGANAIRPRREEFLVVVSPPEEEEGVEEELRCRQS